MLLSKNIIKPIQEPRLMRRQPESRLQPKEGSFSADRIATYKIKNNLSDSKIGYIPVGTYGFCDNEMNVITDGLNRCGAVAITDGSNKFLAHVPPNNPFRIKVLKREFREQFGTSDFTSDNSILIKIWHGKSPEQSTVMLPILELLNSLGLLEPFIKQLQNLLSDEQEDFQADKEPARCCTLFSRNKGMNFGKFRSLEKVSKSHISQLANFFDSIKDQLPKEWDLAMGKADFDEATSVNSLINIQSLTFNS